MDAWIKGISSDPPLFDDPFKSTNQAAREHIIAHLISKVNPLISIVDREENKIKRSAREPRPSGVATSGPSEGIVAALQMTYQGPGELRSDGPRHDNDFIDITDIRTAPTHDELMSRIPPFLPSNFHNAPHPLPAESMERLLDIQFRLLREELTYVPPYHSVYTLTACSSAPLRTSVQLVCDDFKAPPRSKTKLSDIVEKRGGKYHGFADGQESVMFNVYTNIFFAPLMPDRRGITVGITIDTPPGRARAHQASMRADFWRGMSGKRLMQGGLVALIWKRGNDVTVHLGTLASSLDNLMDSARKDANRLAVRVTFFDPALELLVLQTLKNKFNYSAVLVEAPVMFEAVRPFLEALRVEPESVPFGEYLVHRPPGFFRSFVATPPRFASVPGFSYQLSSLFPSEAGMDDLKMSVNDMNSIEFARQELRRTSRLDPSQADAIVDTLTRKLSLIQGFVMLTFMLYSSSL
jgi:hypothetical protein